MKISTIKTSADITWSVSSKTTVGPRPRLRCKTMWYEPDQLIAAARMFGKANRGVAVGGTGPDMAPHGVLTERLILTLNTICGRFNREGESVNPGRLHRRYRGVPSHEARRAFGHGPHSRVRGLGEIIGECLLSLNDEILLDGKGQVKALICLGGNPMVAFPTRTN